MGDRPHPGHQSDIEEPEERDETASEAPDVLLTEAISVRHVPEKSDCCMSWF